MFHKWDGNSGGEEADEGVVVHDTSMSGVTLEGQDITFEGQGELPVFLDYMVGEKPGDGIPSSVLMFKGFLELSKEVVPAFKGHSCANDCILLEGIGPGQGRPFGHV